MSQQAQGAGARLVMDLAGLLRLAARPLLIAAALLLAWMALARLGALLVYPYPHDGLEGTLLYEARLLRAGEPLYMPLELYRFKSAPYPPLHPLLLALFDLIPGPHVFWGGRLLSLLAALGGAALAALLVRRAGWPAALLAAALLLSAPPLQLWATRIKPDVLALLFTLSGLSLASRALDDRRPAAGGRWSVAGAALCFALAFYTKQTALAGPLAAGLALLTVDARDWLGRRRGGPAAEADGQQRANDRRLSVVAGLPISRRTLGFGALYLALALGTWALLDLVTGGQYTLHVWWGGRRAEWWSFVLFSKIVALLGFWWPLMLLAAAAVPLALRRRALLVPACYALVAPLTLLGAGETGAHHNHLLETHAALAIAGCAAVGCLCGLGGARRGAGGPAMAIIAGAAALALGLGQAWLALSPPAWYAGELEPGDPPERYLVFMRGTAGEILADDTGLLLQAGRELRYDDPSTMGPAAAIGKWDQRGLLEEIASKRFSAIMIPVNLERSTIDPAGRWTPEMLAAIKAHYQLKFRDTIYTYVPRE